MNDTESSTSNSTISTSEMKAIVEQFKTHRHSKSTRGTYYGIWKNFNQFCICLVVKPNEWEQHLTLYVAF